MKKLILFSLLIVIAVGGVFAQMNNDGSKKNTIFFGPIMAGYERTLFSGLSVGAEAGFNFFGLGSEGWLHLMPLFADAFVRWYPWQKIFFADLGLGYQGGGITAGISDDDERAGGFHIKPQVGWRIDIGNAGGWIFETRAGFGITIGGDVNVTTITVPVLFGRIL
jgi:hypothetical protein